MKSYQKINQLIECVAFTVLVILLGTALVSCDPTDMGDVTDAVGTESVQMTESYTIPNTEPDGTTEPEPEYSESVFGGIVYHVYADHAVAVGGERDNAVDIILSDTIGGVPVTEIADGAFDGIRQPRICCDASYSIYETARTYAIEHDHIFVEMNTDTFPDHYYPDWVEKLNWDQRDRSGDNFTSVDDNSRITELVDKYLAGDSSVYDELLQRVMYRYACANRMARCIDRSEEFSFYSYEPYTGDNFSMTDYDRYDIYEDGIRLKYRFAYADIDTYEAFCDYVYLFYTQELVDEFLEAWVTDVEGAAFMNYSGIGFDGLYKDPAYSLEVKADVITLRERREIWDPDDEVPLGEYIETEVVLEKHDDKWQLPYSPMSFINYPDIPEYYTQLYGG